MKYETLLDRFLGYVKVNTRSDENSTTTPTTQSQKDFVMKLGEEMKKFGVQDIHYVEQSGYIVGTIPANTDKDVRKIGYLSHVDTADFNADGINPQVIESYDGGVIKLGETEFTLDPKDFPSLNNYHGQTLIHTDGTTLLGADDKSIAEAPRLCC